MKRDSLVDRLKGYACLLVLFGHVIMGIRKAGINIPEIFRGMEIFIWSFHVSLFLFLSGVVYRITGQWHSKGTRWSFIKHKFITLAVPYVIFSVVYVVINSLAGKANTEYSLFDVLNIWKVPIAQYWFLYALFFLFVIWTFMPFKNYITTVIVALLAYIVPLFGLGFGFFDFVMYSSLAFGLGTFISVSSLEKTPTPLKAIIIALHFITAVVLIRYNLAEKLFIKEILMFFGIVSSIMLISIIQKANFVGRFLDIVSKYSFQIYLLHTIFTSGARIILVRLGILSWGVHVILGTLAGLLFSYLAAKICSKVKILNACFFPSVLYKSKNKKAN